VKPGDSHALLRSAHSFRCGFARAVGFSSQAKFTTAFGRVAGVTPGEFRRRAAVEPASPAGSLGSTSGGSRRRARRSSGSALYGLALPVAWMIGGSHGAHALLALL